MTTSSRPDNEVIRASAGTGKTFQLSNRFLGLVAADVPLDTILATTFTRKAAGEILGRVLSRLAEAAADSRKLSELAACIKTPLGRPRCLGLLAGMVRRLHRLRVSTLDSFFLEVARSFSLELGLPPGWRIVDEVDDARLRAEAIRAVLQKHSTGDVLRLMHLLTKGEAARPVSWQIAGLVESLYSAYLESSAAAWAALPRHKPLSDAEVEKAIESLDATELPANVPFQSARREAVAAAREKQWAEFVRKGLVAKILEGSDQFARRPISASLRETLQPLIDHARAEILGQIANQTEATRRLLEHFDAAYRELKQSRRALRFEDVTRLVGDAALGERVGDVAHRLDAHVSHLLLDEFQDTSPPQWRVLRPFARRAAAGTDRGSVAPSRSLFCVGDVKQAIYGWRGGEAEIFDAIQKELPGLAEQSLDTSYRSSPVVIDTLNRVFENLAANAVLRQDKYLPAATEWAKRFHRHTTAKDQLPGHCRLTVAPGVESPESRVARRETEVQGKQSSSRLSTLDSQLSTLRFAADEVARLHREAPGFSIGVLVRRNATVARIIYELGSRRIEASEEGGNPLSDSPAVELVLSLLTLADHPGHTAARFHVAQSPLGPRIGLDRYQDDAAACALARDIRRALVDDGYGPTISGWARQLAPHCDARDHGRLVQLVEMAYAYEPAATLRTDDFVAKVRETRVEDPRGAAVRVMTVHQAKGLQFDVVVLPELDVRLTGQPPQVVVSRPGPAQPIDRVLRYVGKEVRPLLPKPFQEMFDEHDRRVVEESLCVFYVAMTRAVYALHMIVAPSAENEKSLPATMAGVLRAALTDGRGLEPGSIAYESGDAEWWREEERGRRKEEEDTQALGSVLHPSSFILHPSSKRPTRGLQRRSPSQLEGGASVSLAQRLRLDTGQSLQRGTLIHAWFEQIEWLDGGEPDEKTLRDVAAASVSSPAFDVSGVLAQFRRALGAPAIRAALSRSTYEWRGERREELGGRREEGAKKEGGPRSSSVDPSSLLTPYSSLLPPFPPTPVHAGPQAGTDRRLVAPRWEVWRERPFVLREEDVILSGAIDRLVALYDGDRVVGADVLDFKTDVLPAGDPAALAARVEFYRPQLAAYRRAAARLLGLEPARVSARLVFTELGDVHAV